VSARRISVVVAAPEGGSRSDLTVALEADGDITVTAQITPRLAPRAARMLRPDLLAIDLPSTAAGREQTLAAIEEVMAASALPVLALHHLQDRVEAVEAAALAAGAAGCAPRPAAGQDAAASALRSRVRALVRGGVAGQAGGRPAPAAARSVIPVVGIAASTGGPAALARVLGGLAGLPAAVLVVQHIDPRFVRSFVEFLRRSSALPVELAADGMPLREGWVHVAPADLHLCLAPGRRVALSPLPDLLHRPSADVLFRSLACHAGGAGVGVVLTGMGEDGAAGLLELRQRGGRVIGQDAATCTVFGMPRAAQRLGAVERLTGLADIAVTVLGAVSEMRP
jgi:two-component system, chemotaxis family, protein-glutamate methylesterase/glutaminase